MSSARTFRSLTVVGSMFAAVLLAPSTHAASVRTFDTEPLGAAPVNAVVQGSATVADWPASFGKPAGDRAVRFLDESSTLQTKANFTFAPTAAVHAEFDYGAVQHKQATFVDIQGTGAPTALGTWRFMISWYVQGQDDATISAYDGRAYQRIAIIPGLTARDVTTRVKIDAGLTAAVITVGKNSYHTTVRAAPATALTGLEFSSAGSTNVGNDFLIDNLQIEPIDPASPTLAPGLSATPTLNSITPGKQSGWTEVAKFDAPGVKKDSFTAEVWADGAWVPTKIDGKNGAFTVQSKLDITVIGRIPVVVRLLDHRTGQQRSRYLFPQSYSTLKTVVAVQEPAGDNEIRFPGATVLQDGSIYVVYSVGAAHTGANELIKATRSTDGGKTWATPWVVMNSQYDDRDPHVTQLRDGTVLLTVFRTNWAVSPSEGMGTYVARSTDNGATFTEETKIETNEPGAWQHAPAVELANGDVLQPLYGFSARIARSTDGGKTFPAANEIVVMREDSNWALPEPNITALLSGELVMTIRTRNHNIGSEVDSLLYRSFDNGYTWTGPEQTDLPMSSHSQILLASGKVFVAWGNLEISGRPTYGTLIDDPSGPWTGYRAVPIYNAGWDDQANPAVVQLADGRILIFGQDVGQRALVVTTVTEKELG